jgi:ABC-type transporter Mla subunit MlaD
MSDRKLGYAIICLFLFIFFVICAYCLRPVLSPPHTCVVAFEKIGNLRMDDQVRLKGIAYGKVKKIDWTRKKVFVTVQSGKPLLFHKGYSIITLDAGIMGDRMITIDNGPENAAVIPPADTLFGGFLPGVSEAVGYMWKLGEVIDSLKDMSDLLLHGDARHKSLVVQTKGVINTVDSLSKSVLKFASAIDNNISSSMYSIDHIVNQASRLTKSVSVSAPEYITMLDKQLTKAGSLVATLDTTVNRLIAASDTLSNKDNILWRNDIEKLSGDLVTVQKTLTGIQKELLQFKSYLRLW